MIVRGRAATTDAERREALSSLGQDDPVWRAVVDVLLDEIDNATSQQTSIELADKPGAMAHCAGGAEWMKIVLDRLYELRNKRDEEHLMPRWLRNWMPVKPPEE